MSTSDTTFTTRNGRGVTIYRLQKRIDGAVHYAKAWTFRKRIAGNAEYFNLGPDRSKAAKAADGIDAYFRLPGATVEEAKRRWDSRHALETAAKIDYPSIGDLLEAHRKAEPKMDLKQSTAKGYRSCLLVLIRRAMAYRKKKALKVYTGRRQSFDYPERKLSVDILDAALVHDFKAQMVSEAGGNHAKEQTAKRSANKTLRNARALFTPEAMEHYIGMKLPDLRGFLDVPIYRRVDRAKKYIILSNETVVKVFMLGDWLRRNDVECWKIYMLALRAGCRREEAAHSQVSWVLKDQSALWIHSGEEFSTKSIHERVVKVAPWVVAELNGIKGNAGYLVKGTTSDRERDIPDRLNFYLAQCGLDRRHRIHELRKLFGSYVASSKDLFSAQKALGHASPQITSDTYADRLENRLFVFWEMPLESASKHASVGEWKKILSTPLHIEVPTAESITLDFANSEDCE